MLMGGGRAFACVLVYTSCFLLSPFFRISVILSLVYIYFLSKSIFQLRLKRITTTFARVNFIATIIKYVEMLPGWRHQNRTDFMPFEYGAKKKQKTEAWEKGKRKRDIYGVEYFMIECSSHREYSRTREDRQQVEAYDKCAVRHSFELEMGKFVCKFWSTLLVTTL